MGVLINRDLGPVLGPPDVWKLSTPSWLLGPPSSYGTSKAEFGRGAGDLPRASKSLIEAKTITHIGILNMI